MSSSKAYSEADEEELAGLVEKSPEVRLRRPGSPLHQAVRAPSDRLDADEEGTQDGGLDNFWHRAGWLVLLLFCQSTSSIILEHFDYLIRKHPVVIYFLTMLVGAGGNAGGQSTVLVVRRLALATVRGKSDRLSAFSVIGDQVSVALKLAIILFVASFIRCVVFQVRGVECLAICLSMLAIVFSSTIIGAALPFVLHRMGIDPAHAGATIQVIMDVSGVLLTCLVSCAVLGVPMDGEQVATNTTTTTSVAALARSLQVDHEGIEQAGTQAESIVNLGSFNGFGKSAGK
eukprot:TRINITY_DN9996_c0_g5_i1.p1 TRINITY_DN9996_c0_g5~~TRINITY_DN9996_c0_g5_i1.p1  ORF type:complete len:288 (-),score=28.99 TRINITY_DN9996_c0_g5_i1:211-1074(-)